MAADPQGALNLGLEPTSSAVLSDDGCYRYRLHRALGDGPPALFVMLNPSTADASQDDPTIRRCKRFAADSGHGALEVVNVYALRATNPRELAQAEDPVGPRNDHEIHRAAYDTLNSDGTIVCAWGSRPTGIRTRDWVDRLRVVVDHLTLGHPDRLTALDTTADRSPRHPLYLSADLRPRPWWPGDGVPDGR